MVVLLNISTKKHIKPICPKDTATANGVARTEKHRDPWPYHCQSSCKKPMGLHFGGRGRAVGDAQMKKQVCKAWRKQAHAEQAAAFR